MVSSGFVGCCSSGVVMVEALVDILIDRRGLPLCRIGGVMFQCLQAEKIVRCQWDE